MLSCSENIVSSAEELGTFASYFEKQVRKSPSSVAIEFEGSQWTYADTNAQANQIARFLLSHGFQREDRIGICMDRSATAIITMLGILKSGCAFVPLDPEFPKDRLAFIVEDASIQLIFCDSIYRDLYDVASTNAPRFVDPLDSQLRVQDTDDLDVRIPEHSLAYVMYTSGSTGKPKGVQIEHRSLTTYCLADVDLYRLRSDDRTLQFSTLNFDIAIEEIFPPLMVGSAVVVRPRERADVFNELSHLVESNGITALHIATAYWNEWVDLLVASRTSVPRSLRLVIATGEKISVEHYRRWKQHCSHEVLWCNAYGPTETTVTCTAFVPDSNWDAAQMPIGKPLLRYSAHILNDQNHSVASGETGQLFISGPALARGYLNRSDRNELAFIHVILDGDTEPTRLYRTGDLARWLPSGDIEFSGRVDHQMKIGSYRIEPGEIEAVLSQCESVRESLVIGAEREGQKYLAAYVVLNQPNCSAFELASFLRGRLPVYMVPSRYIFLDYLPKTINGKIDRVALPAAENGEIPRENDYREAETELERSLAKVWSSVLNIPRVGRDDDFFQLGGSSLLVTRVIAQMAGKLDCAIPVRDFFANPTISSLSRHLALISSNALAETNECNQSHVHEQNEQSLKLRSKLPKIQPVSIPNCGETLAGILYPAVRNGVERQNHCLVICNAYGHEHTRSARNLQQLAIQLAQSGLNVLRFDYAGTGNSTGNHDQVSLDVWRSNIAAAVDYAVNHAWKKGAIDSSKSWAVSLLGIRLGASLIATTPLSGIEHVILWDPIIDGDRYLELLKGYHQHELSSLTRYLSHRSGQPDQLLGYECPIAFQRSLSSICLWKQTQIEAQQRWILSSQDYLKLVAIESLPATWDHRPCTDDIFWDKQDFTGRAFSSPHVSQNIRSILTKGTQ
ncbi:MAG: amino acid adenylation domain-containing protein [Pirellulaceae bacterium]|nr:amino acid adenylation domain-containing protein [Pirellulaceae bacterium]